MSENPYKCAICEIVSTSVRSVCTLMYLWYNLNIEAIDYSRYLHQCVKKTYACDICEIVSTSIRSVCTLMYGLITIFILAILYEFDDNYDIPTPPVRMHTHVTIVPDPAHQWEWIHNTIVPYPHHQWECKLMLQLCTTLPISANAN